MLGGSIRRFVPGGDDGDDRRPLGSGCCARQEGRGEEEAAAHGDNRDPEREADARSHGETGHRGPPVSASPWRCRSIPRDDGPQSSVRTFSGEKCERVRQHVDHGLEAFDRRAGRRAGGVEDPRQGPSVPAMPRDSRPSGFTVRIASARPGASRSSTVLVASGVRSVGENPVPPVVTTTPRKFADSSRSADRNLVHPVGHHAPVDDGEAGRVSRIASAAPERSSRSPG